MFMFIFILGGWRFGGGFEGGFGTLEEVGFLGEGMLGFGGKLRI